MTAVKKLLFDKVLNYELPIEKIIMNVCELVPEN